MQIIKVYYISLSGNTTSFLADLDTYCQKQYQKKVDYVNV